MILFCLKVDLAITVGLLILNYSSFLTIRELTGPFKDELIVNIIMAINQSLYFTFLSCVLSLQLVQVFSVFFAPTFIEWREDLIIATHRVIIVSTGFLIGIFICYIGEGMCRPTPLQLYFLQETKAIAIFKQLTVTTNVLYIFVLVILVCQILIEVKKYWTDKQEMKADFIARSACRNMKEARDKLRGQAILELGVEHLLPQVRLAWQENDVENINPDHHSEEINFQLNQNPSTEQRTLQQTPNSELIRLESSSDGENYLSSFSTNQAVHVARYICIFGILPTLLAIISLSLENIDSVRPHAAIALNISTYGSVIPLTLIISSSKMRNFAKMIILKMFKLECS